MSDYSMYLYFAHLLWVTFWRE